MLLALTGGRLIPPELVDEMAMPSQVPGGEDYGLGLSRATLSCGIEARGHNGALHWYMSETLVTANGTSAGPVLNSLDLVKDTATWAKGIRKTVDAALREDA